MKPDGPSLRTLRLFRDAYELLRDGEPSLKDVAKSLRQNGKAWNAINDKDLGRRLREIERQVFGRGGSKLFNKVGRQNRPTPEGIKFHEDIYELLSFYDEVVNLRSRHVRFGATNAIITYLLPEAMGKFLIDADAEVEIREGEFFDLTRWLQRKEIDFALGPASGWTGHVEKEFIRLKRVLICHPAHRFKRLSSTTFQLEDLAHELLLCLPDEFQPDFCMSAALPRSIPPGKRVLLRNYAEMHEWVKRGTGVAVVHDMHILPGDKSVHVIDLSDILRQTTPVMFYFPASGEESLSDEARTCVKCIRETVRHISTLSGE